MDRQERRVEKQLMEGITKVMTGLKIPPDAVGVVLQDIPRDNGGVGGCPAREKLPHIP